MNTTPISFVFKFQLVLVSDQQRASETARRTVRRQASLCDWACLPKAERIDAPSPNSKITMLSKHSSNKSAQYNPKLKETKFFFLFRLRKQVFLQCTPCA
jgi:hypothetical protein